MIPASTYQLDARFQVRIADRREREHRDATGRLRPRERLRQPAHSPNPCRSPIDDELSHDPAAITAIDTLLNAMCASIVLTRFLLL